MSNRLTPDTLMAKAYSLCSTARLVLDHGDTDSAVNRAYYAMFHAARAALLLSGVSNTRTHSGLIRMFGLHLIENGTLASEFGEALSRAHETRLMADYKDTAIKPAAAKVIVEQAEHFVATIKSLLLDKQPEPTKQEPSGSSFDPF